MKNNSYLPREVKLKIDDNWIAFWKRKGSVVFCVLVNTQSNKSYHGKSVKKKSDEFDMVFGMRKALESVFRNNDIFKDEFDKNGKKISSNARNFRKRIYKVFKDSYGLGICNSKETISSSFLVGNGSKYIYTTSNTDNL